MCSTLEEVGHFLKLWDVAQAVVAVVNEQREHVVELSARVRRVEPREFTEHSVPVDETYS